MVIYHLRAMMISCSQGRSATAAIAYRVVEWIEDRCIGLTFDYAVWGGVDYIEILALDYAPDWVYDRSELWNRVEESETRKNSQVVCEVCVALPDELTHAEWVELVWEFVRSQFVDWGMVADIALHALGRAGDERNHHAHILLTTRELGAERSVPGGGSVPCEGFTTKNRDWNKVEVLEGWREAWARDSNAALERAGIEDRVDYWTLVAQRDEALELASAARERGDEGAELHEIVRAMSLDCSPLLQLSLGVWQLKECGVEVAAVRVWHEVKAQAVEVTRMVQELAGQVCDWLDCAAERVMDCLEPARFAGLGQFELVLAGGRDGREEEPNLATRLRDAWEARQGCEKEQHVDAPEREASEALQALQSSQDLRDLAVRLREAAKGIDLDALADRAAALREGREAEERHIAQEAVREQERVKELEC